MSAPGRKRLERSPSRSMMKLLLIQSDLVSHSLTIALPRALDRASARGVFSPSTCSSPPLVGIADHAGIGSLQ
eukprot:COSAG04_NODE_15618_length_523_cov_1.023419_2_plen_72_part_01